MSESPQRWRVRKAARKAVVLGSFASSSIAVRRLMGGTRVRAIAYHRFGQSVLTEAAPILQRYGVPSVAIIRTQAIGDPDAGKGVGEAFLTWEQVYALDAGGMDAWSLADRIL